MKEASSINFKLLENEIYVNMSKRRYCDSGGYPIADPRFHV